MKQSKFSVNLPSHYFVEAKVASQRQWRKWIFAAELDWGKIQAVIPFLQMYIGVGRVAQGNSRRLQNVIGLLKLEGEGAEGVVESGMCCLSCWSGRFCTL